MHRPATSILVGLVWTLASGSAALAGVATTQPSIRIVDLRGDPAAIGRQHGQKLGKNIRLLHEKYLRPWFGTTEQYGGALEIAGQFGNFMQPEHKAEIDALAKAAGLPPNASMLANCFLDLAPMTACSTVSLPAKAAPDGVARFGRTLDFASMDVADRHTIVLVMHPKNRYAFATVTWPGLIGALSGMNEHGLTLANMEVSRPRIPPRAMPYILLYRTVLEQCRTVEEAIALLRKTARQTSNNLMLMDPAGNRAVVEITPEKIVVRKGPADAALISTNHQRGSDLDSPGRCSRFDYLHDTTTREFGRIDIPAIQRMLCHIAQGKMTMQAMVFEPANRTIYLAAGAEATKYEYQRIDLAKHFRE